MSTFRRRQMMASAHGGGGSKPYDAEIEYLESDGTQYIDTGVMYNDSSALCEVNIVFSFTEINTSDNNIFFGAYGGSSVRLFTFVGSDKKWKLGFGNVTSSNITATTSTEYSANIRFKNKSQDLTVNGTNIINSSNVFSTIRTNLCLFGVPYNQALISPSKIKVKSFDLSINNTKLIDFIPVRIGQVGYLYDKVSGQLFGNSGTGDFILGNDKN